jgi:myo-inositol catabolism protein IolC
MSGAIDDDEAVRRMAATYASLIQAWERARERSRIAVQHIQPAAHAASRE